ncbi:MAG: metallophosphoesterase [Rhizobiaceae bacterium]|nr:metallophosphoesterase [Rhizobiaceae bacterium]
MFRLAHISDVHLSPLPDLKFHQLLSKRITGYLNWKLNRKHKIGDDYLTPLLDRMKAMSPDHTVVTGDLTNLALPAEIARARKFLDSLGGPENVSALCGNHDAYVPGSVKKAIQAWMPYLSSEETPITSKHSFPYLRRQGDISLIGCNSADATAPFMATGYFRKKQAKKLGSLLEETRGTFRMVMIHHPPIAKATPYHKRLIGIKHFQNAIRGQGAELVLHGHTHMPDYNEIEGAGMKVPVIGVPAAGNGVELIKPVGRFNLFDIEKKQSGWEMHWTAFDRGDQGGEPLEDRRFVY